MEDENKIWSEYWTEKKLWFGLLKITPTYKGIVKLFKSINLPKDAKILDAGCGTGKLASFWLNEGYDILGIDISDFSLAITNKKGVKTMRADILKGLPLEDNSFDLVYSDGLLEHFIDPEPILKELFRVSRRYVLTLVPRIELYSTVAAAILKPPKEYKREDSEWINLHEVFNPKTIEVKKIRFGVLSLLCSKPNTEVVIGQ